MPKKSLLLLGIAFFILTGCAKNCPAPESCPETPGPLTSGVEDGAGRIRITLNADGTVDKIEGRDAGGNWEPDLKEQNTPPLSLGTAVATIEIFEHNGSEDDVASGGAPLHSHAGGQSPPWGSHCHRWVKINNVNTLIHC